MSKKKIIKTVIICLVFAALIAGLITMMVLPQDYGNPDSLGIGKSNFGQRLLIGLQVALLGIGTVFVMLILLILVVTLMRLIFQGAGKLKESQAAKKAQSAQKQEAIIEEKVAIDDEDEEVVAVIMAALNAYYETQEVTYKSNLKFRVRSIKEI
ncbi:MAG: OadG family protein [Clostridia bacterium]|nr:OadG family protein [Clostridia bacterium]MDE7208375.1 OadG family protein [Clostridia bacterium]